MTNQGGSASVIRADARALPLADSSVDLIVTSPPYFGLRSYQDGGQHYEGQVGAEATPQEFVAALLECTREMTRVLKPSGSIWVNLGDKYENKGLRGLPWRYALAVMDDLGLLLRAEVIWSKPNGLPDGAKDRVRRTHEQWFQFAVSPRYFAALDEIREPQVRTVVGATGRHGAGKHSRMADGRTDQTEDYTFSSNRLGKLPGSIRSVASAHLKVPSQLGVDHPATFPPAWPAWIIRGWAPEGGTVLDPFGGAGTTALAAKALGRHGISSDLCADYGRLAEWRTNDPKELARVAKLLRAGKLGGVVDSPLLTA